MHDAIIIGAGPAGCAAARLLAAWGHRVLLVDRPHRPVHAAVESLPPSARPLAATIGLLDIIDDPRVQPWRGNVVWWGGAAARIERFADGIAGQQLRRDRFDERMRAAAIAAGADCAPARVTSVEIPGVTGDGDGMPAVMLETDGDVRRAAAPLVIDASGRAGVVARHHLRVAADAAAPRTIAVSAEWRAPSWPGVDDGHTLIASYANGWAWSIAPAPGVRHFTVMVDPTRSQLTRDASADDVYRREIEQVAPFRALIAGAEIAGRPWGADATAYTAQKFAGPGFLLAGDAGASLDPLSSFGLKKALASGWLAAIVARTVLLRPSLASAAMAFFDRRERAMQEASARAAAAFASEAMTPAPSAFWSVRAAESGASTHLDEDDPAALARDAGVRAAFADLKARRTIALKPGPALKIELRPAVRGREIALDDHLILPAWPDGVRYLRGIDLLALVHRAPQHTDAGELFVELLHAHPAADLADVAGALATLIARGALVHTPA